MGKLQLSVCVSFLFLCIFAYESTVCVNNFTDVTFPFPKQVSQITVRPSETRMYELLQCTQEWTIPYSQIYVEGELCHQ